MSISPSDNGRTLKLEDVLSLAKAALIYAGCDDENASAVAETLWKAERDGAHSHGLYRLPGYIASLASGKVNGHARPHFKLAAPGVLHVDGDGGYAPISHKTMLEPLEKMTRSQGLAIAAITNTHHFAALWVEVEMLSELGLVAIACTSYKPAIPPAGGTKPLYGTNPLAFGWPREGKEPLVFDQASAVKARGEIMLAARDGHILPEGTGIDSNGKPTTDPNAVLTGAILPFGGYKGASLALMIELLAGPLIGESLSFETAKTDNNDGGPPRGGELIVAIDPERVCGKGGFLAHAELLFTEMLKQDGVRLPADGRRARRKNIEASGVRITKDIFDLLAPPETFKKPTDTKPISVNKSISKTSYQSPNFSASGPSEK